MGVVSGIAVATAPEHLDEVRRAIDALEWAEVHYAEPDGRMVVVLEADSTDKCMDRLLEIQKMPHIVFAEMSEHVFEDERFPEPDPTSQRPIDRLAGPVEGFAKSPKGHRRT